MSNPWAQLDGLLDQGGRSVVTIDVVNSDGTSSVTLRSGDAIRVRGDSVGAGQKAIIQGGEIKGKAPDLPAVTIEV